MFDEIFNEKTAQVSIASGFLFFVIAHENVLKAVSDFLKSKLKINLTGSPLLLFHSVLFAFLVGVINYYIFRPLMAYSEGQACAAGFEKDENDECVMKGTANASANTANTANTNMVQDEVPCQLNADCDAAGLTNHMCNGVKCVPRSSP